MTAMDRLVASLQNHEGFVGVCYDDATGMPIGPGSHVVGHPTIGYGWALDVHPVTRTQAAGHLRETVQEAVFDLTHRLPWMLDLDEPRRNALYELAYNLGVDGLLLFSRMLTALKARRYAEAGEQLMDSQWAREDVSTARSAYIKALLVSGEWPADTPSRASLRPPA